MTATEPLKPANKGTPGYVKMDPPTKVFPPEQEASVTTGAPRIVAEGSVATLQSIDPEERDKRHAIAVKIIELDANVQYCHAAKIEWLEVDPDLLAHFSGGELPAAGYIIYKNVRLCLKGAAEEIAHRERLTVHEVLYKDENYMKVR